jgi:hypothetical protein
MKALRELGRLIDGNTGAIIVAGSVLVIFLLATGRL